MNEYDLLAVWFRIADWTAYDLSKAALRESSSSHSANIRSGDLPCVGGVKILGFAASKDCRLLGGLDQAAVTGSVA
jgi:hypothetical protein